MTVSNDLSVNQNTTLGDGSGDSVSIDVSSNGLLDIDGLLNDNSVDSVLVINSQGRVAWADADSLMAQSNNAWLLEGNSGTDTATNFLGTIDNVPLVLRVNNQEAARVVPVGGSAPRLGIGTSNPQQQLHITENMEIPATGGGLGIIYKNGARFIHNFNGGTFVGVNAGNLSQPTGPNTSSNIGVGPAALSNLDAAEFNVAIGASALGATTTGGRNVGIGGLALLQNTTGSMNTAIGSLAGQNNTTGSENIVIGEQSLIQNQTGSRNVAIGVQSLFGFGSSGQSPSNNVALGHRSGFRVTTGSSNVLVGLQTGDSLTTGSNNVIIGQRSGQTLTAGNNNILIGSGISAPVVTGSNQLSLGNLIFGTGIDGTGTSVSSGNVGIGVNAPSTRLHVESVSDPLRLEGLVTDNTLDNVLVVDGTGVVHNRSVSDIVDSNAWSLTGNAGTNATTNFLGTTDAVDVVFRTNNTERARFDDANGGHFVPGADDTYDLGSSLLRWRDLYLGPASLHFPTTAGETGTPRDWHFGVDTAAGTAQGNLAIGESGTQIISVDPDGHIGINEPDPQASIHITHGRFDPIEDQSLRFEIDDSNIAGGDDYGAIEWYQQNNRTARILGEASGTSRNAALRFFTTDQALNEVEALTLITDNATLNPRVGIAVNVPTPPALFTVGPLSTTLIGDGTDSVGNNGFNFRTRDFGDYMVGFHNNDVTASGSHGVLIKAGNIVGNNKSLNVIRATDNEDLLMVRSSGRVGVHQSLPSTSLHVTPLGSDDPLRLEGLVTDTTLSNVLVVDANGVVHQRTASNLAATNAWLLGGNSAASSNIFGTLDSTNIDIRTNNVTAVTVDGGTQEVTVSNDLTVNGQITGTSDSTILGDNSASQQLIVDGVVDAAVGDSLSTNPSVWDATVDGDLVATGLIKAGGSIWIDGTSATHQVAADAPLDIATTTASL